MAKQTCEISFCKSRRAGDKLAKVRRVFRNGENNLSSCLMLQKKRMLKNDHRSQVYPWVEWSLRR